MKKQETYIVYTQNSGSPSAISEKYFEGEFETFEEATKKLATIQEYNGWNKFKGILVDSGEDCEWQDLPEL